MFKFVSKRNTSERILFMKWKQYILIGTFLTLLIPTKVYAGNINGNEQSVIAVASGTFEYKGVTYKATSQHLAELRAKLMQDDVDLTTEQAREAIGSIYANIKAGIDEGYIVPISGSLNTEEKDVTESNKVDTGSDNKKENSQDEESSATQSSQNGGEIQNTDKNNSDNKNGVLNTNNSANQNNTTSNNDAVDKNSQKIETNKDKISNKNTQTSTSDNIGNESTIGKTEQKEEIKEVKTPEQLKWEKEQLPKLKKQKENIIAENFIGELEVKQLIGQLQKGEQEQLQEQSTENLETTSSETVIKDTACNFSNIWLVPIIFFIGIGICIMSIMKYHLLAHKNES